MPPKQIIALATHHHVQLKGHALNDRFGKVISVIRENYPVQIILEEWTLDRQSFASTLDTDKLKWKNVGTPKEKRFETYAYGLNTDPPTHDPKKPMLQEYGPCPPTFHAFKSGRFVSTQSRNVRFHGLLQGCSASTWYLGLILFWGLSICSASPGGRRPEGLAGGRTGSGQERRRR